METQYLGEHLGFGQFGNILLIISFVASLLSAFAYLFKVIRKADQDAWLRLGRIAFAFHGVAVIGIVALIYYLIQLHYFEYHYVWQHSSSILPTKYMWACLWEGQEGSFLIWTFWHVVLCSVIRWKGGEWEAPVMLFMMMIQVFLASMLLGLEFGHIKIGSNPFILLRNHESFANLPFIHMPDYLSKIKDGRGLNPLLQNYWMVIHPPTLFLGFASTAIPFAFAMAGLVTGKVKEWVKPALPWAYFSVGILGVGILMGGAWAYEALSFGGFWAWDPVENASLVPWLTMVGAAHVMLINKKNGTSLLSTFILTTVSFVLVLYSTFLTRSGILGETSVHAFTDLGMTGQLILYMVYFLVLSLVLIIYNWKKLKAPEEDEKVSSREFWIFMGMLVLVISAVQITITTSIPVINKMFDTKMAPPADAIDFYNSWQLPLAVVISILIAIGQYFKWRESDMKVVLKKLSLSFIIAIIIAGVFEYIFRFPRFQHVFLLFSSIWAFTSNLDYLIRVIKGKINYSGSSIAHMGIALILLGALISNAEKQVISRNVLNIDLGKDFPNAENILLYQHDTLAMGEYYLSYKGKEKDGVNIYYEIEYFKANHTTGQLEKVFSLKPIVQINERMGNVSEPATAHFFNKDIYTHITYADLDEKPTTEESEEYKKPKEYTIKTGDTLTTSNSLVVYEGLNKTIDKKELFLGDEDLAVGAQFRVIDVNKKNYTTQPVFIIKGTSTFTKESEIKELGLKFAFSKIIPEENKILISIAEKKTNSKEFVIMKAIIFPQINILWTGCILMMLGSFIAVRKRILDLKDN
ncbi:cytochrome c biogenesis protein CcsA [soil metagenome]